MFPLPRMEAEQQRKGVRNNSHLAAEPGLTCMSNVTLSKFQCQAPCCELICKCLDAEVTSGLEDSRYLMRTTSAIASAALLCV